jgi:hypothetical protein
MDLKEQIITEYLTQGSGFRKLAAKRDTTQCPTIAKPCSLAEMAE